ncbi:MAG: Co2+/Mg2+ efflux protein ApaG [Bacteroidetes bacterium]|nr:Co2+/Mg2+ efflux protein ApaG [Bacteroidota bacterium]
MVKTTTHNIEISVEARYLSEQSVPRENHYFFVYFITIKNNSDYSVQLLRRHWDIFDSVGEKRDVEGEGVIGETPVIEPGQKFEYNSGCNLASELGYMEGFYIMTRLIDETEFNVQIPRFELVVPSKFN